MGRRHSLLSRNGEPFSLLDCRSCAVEVCIADASMASPDEIRARVSRMILAAPEVRPGESCWSRVNARFACFLRRRGRNCLSQHPWAARLLRRFCLYGG